MTRPIASRVAWSMWAVALGLMAIAVPFLLLSLDADVPSGATPRGLDVALALLSALTFSTIGAVVAARRPRNPIGWVFACAGLLGAFGFLSLQYAIYGLAAPGSLPAPSLAAWAGRISYSGAYLAIASLFLLFPTGRLLSHRWRPLLWAVVLWIFSFTLSILFTPGPLGDGLGPNPVILHGAVRRVIDLLTGVVWVVVLPILIAAASALVVRFHRSRGVERQQLKWLVYTGGMAAVGLTVLVVVDVVRSLGWLEGASFERTRFLLGGLIICSVLAMPLAAGIAILKYRIYDIDLIINRTLVYGALTATLLVTYILLVAGVSSFAGESNLSVAGATLAVAALFQPLRRRIQSFIDRRFYRRKYDAAKTLEVFSTRLRDEIDIESLTAELLTVVQLTMQPAHASLWLKAFSGSRE